MRDPILVSVRPAKGDDFEAWLLETRKDKFGDEGLIQYKTVNGDTDDAWISMSQIRLSGETQIADQGPTTDRHPAINPDGLHT